MDSLALPLFLISALLLTTLLSLAQHRYYVGTVRRLAAEHNRPGLVLVSGRAKGRLRGAVVLLVLDAERTVLDARLMEGATVVSRFRRRPTWVGQSADRPLPDPCSPRAAKAVADALLQVPGTARPAPVGSPLRTGQNLRTAFLPRR